MTRLSLDPNNFAVQVKQLQDDLTQFKNAQRSGKDIWRPHVIECLDLYGNPTVYDLAAIWDGVVGDNAQQNFTATFVADHQPDAFAIPLYRVYYGAPGQLAPISSDIAGRSYLNFNNVAPFIVSHEGHFGTNYYPDNHNAYLKVYFYATDTGTLTVQATP